MTATATLERAADSPSSAPRARIGLIIPSVNSLSEPQFNHFAPPGLTVHAARARVAGPWRRPLPQMADEIALSAQLLADCGPDLIVFHCTETSMIEGAAGEGKILDMIRDATGIAALATSRLVLETLRALQIRKVVVLSPYPNNHGVMRYLDETGFSVVHDVALGLTAREFAEVTPQRWLELAQEHDRPDADGIFLSCTNTTQIEAIADIERALGKPVVNSNQAVLWGVVKSLRHKLGTLPPMPRLGRLMSKLD